MKRSLRLIKATLSEAGIRENDNVRQGEPAEHTTLYFKAGNSDKVYKVFLTQRHGGYTVDFEYGKRGAATLNTGSKTPDPLPLEQARAVYNRLVASKVGKGYLTSPHDEHPTLSKTIGADRWKKTESLLAEMGDFDDPDIDGGQEVTFLFTGEDGTSADGQEFAAVIKKGLGKWYEAGLIDQLPNWGRKTYQSYLTPDDLINWLRRDYKDYHIALA